MHRAVLLLAFLALSAAPLACGRTADPRPGPSPAASVPKGTLLLGERISSPLVPLAEIASHPGQFQNQVVATSGKVTAVCQERGCWMELQDSSGLAHVRMHGHSFFVPKTSSGHLARVQATVLSGPVEHCADQPDPPPGSATAKIELDATGVELD
jgi:hypothetical protein